MAAVLSTIYQHSEWKSKSEHIQQFPICIWALTVFGSWLVCIVKRDITVPVFADWQQRLCQMWGKKTKLTSHIVISLFTFNRPARYMELKPTDSVTSLYLSLQTDNSVCVECEVRKPNKQVILWYHCSRLNSLRHTQSWNWLILWYHCTCLCRLTTASCVECDVKGLLCCWSSLMVDCWSAR